jgi:hypothetical protein
MRLTVVMIAILLLIFAFIYFSRQKFIEIKNDNKEEFENIKVYKYDNINI